MGRIMSGARAEGLMLWSFAWSEGAALAARAAVEKPRRADYLLVAMPEAPVDVAGVGQLSERARIVFRDLIDSYLATGVPVGSRTLSRMGALGLSPASIRNVMQDLEELGLLAAPHTSAGRIPTELGLRLFVDGMMQVAEPAPEDVALIEAEAARTDGSLEDVLARTTTALSALARCAAVVAAPKAEAKLRQLGFVKLAETRALAVLVGNDGTVENRLVELGPGVDAAALERAGAYVSARLAGLTLAEAGARLRDEIASGRAALDAMTAALVEQGLAAWSRDQGGAVLIVKGQAHLLDGVDIDKARALLEEVEEKEALVRVLDRAREAEAMRIFIGAETQLFALSGSSVIAAPFRGAEGRVVGVIGVIGPTRLNYARVVPMVEMTATRLSRLMQ
jgi:heat-inducible transcriptional repressor